MLKITRNTKNDSIFIINTHTNEVIFLFVEKFNGQYKIGMEAPASYSVHRAEAVTEHIHNKELLPKILDRYAEHILMKGKYNYDV
jgi:sRNA-binding carbon storage regulator CsrA